MAILTDTNTEITYRENRSNASLARGCGISMVFLCVFALGAVGWIMLEGEINQDTLYLLLGFVSLVALLLMVISVTWHYSASIKCITRDTDNRILVVKEQSYTLTGLVNERTVMECSLHMPPAIWLEQDDTATWYVRISPTADEHFTLYSGKNHGLAVYLAKKTKDLAS